MAVTVWSPVIDNEMIKLDHWLHLYFELHQCFDAVVWLTSAHENPHHIFRKVLFRNR